MSTFLSFFNRQVPQTIFTPVAHVAPPTQVLVTLDTTTRVDPPEKRRIKNKFKRSSRSSRASRSSRVSRTSGKQLPPLPDTPNAPQANHTTFTLPPRRESLAVSQWYKDSESDCGSSDCGDVTASVYIERPEPKILARKLFFLGFVLPAFWVVGVAIMVTPLRSIPDQELGKTPNGIAWETPVIRDTEFRWSRRCLIALILEMSLIVILIVIVKMGH